MGKYHDRINWKKELRLLPGYIIVCARVALTAAILFWIICASLSSTKEILTGRVMDFSNGLKWDNYVTAWNTKMYRCISSTAWFMPLFPVWAYC